MTNTSVEWCVTDEVICLLFLQWHIRARSGSPAYAQINEDEASEMSRLGMQAIGDVAEEEALHLCHASGILPLASTAGFGVQGVSTCASSQQQHLSDRQSFTTNATTTDTTSATNTTTNTTNNHNHHDYNTNTNNDDNSTSTSTTVRRATSQHSSSSTATSTHNHIGVASCSQQAAVGGRPMLHLDVAPKFASGRMGEAATSMHAPHVILHARLTNLMTNSSNLI